MTRQLGGERNFHVFYQISATSNKDDAWQLPSSPATTCTYLKQGGLPSLASMDDGKEFTTVVEALKALGVSDEDVKHVFALVAGLTHLGDVLFEFAVGDDGGGSHVEDRTVLDRAASLCGLDADKLLQAVTQRTVSARNESYTVRLVPQDACQARDAVAKALYGRLFAWLVRAINKGIQKNDFKKAASIGVLDIFGFECFATNSFEQLCINYTNEKLQQHFTTHIFKNEAALYEAEGVDCAKVGFIDNQPILDLEASSDCDMLFIAETSSVKSCSSYRLRRSRSR